MKMIKPRIVVTGATGKTGSVVVTELLHAGYPVRAMVHRDDPRSARLRMLGAEVVVADMSDPERVADALRDVQRAYYCPPNDPNILHGAVAFAIAAREARLEHIVGLTQCLASPSHPTLMTRQNWLIGRVLTLTAGVAHTIVNPGFFADGYFLTMDLAVRLGVFPWLYGESRNAPPSNEDIARVAVGALKDPARHAGRTYRPTGPKLLGARDMAQAIGRAIGRRVRVLPTPPWLFMKAAKLTGMPFEISSDFRWYIEYHKRGAFEIGAPTTDVLDVTGRAPEDFETIARRYAAQHQNQQILGNWLPAFTRFMIGSVSPGFKPRPPMSVSRCASTLVSHETAASRQGSASVTRSNGGSYHRQAAEKPDECAEMQQDRNQPDDRRRHSCFVGRLNQRFDHETLRQNAMDDGDCTANRAAGNQCQLLETHCSARCPFHTDTQESRIVCADTAVRPACQIQAMADWLNDSIPHRRGSNQVAGSASTLLD